MLRAEYNPMHDLLTLEVGEEQEYDTEDGPDYLLLIFGRYDGRQAGVTVCSPSLIWRDRIDALAKALADFLGIKIGHMRGILHQAIRERKAVEKVL